MPAIWEAWGRPLSFPRWFRRSETMFGKQAADRAVRLQRVDRLSERDAQERVVRPHGDTKLRLHGFERRGNDVKSRRLRLAAGRAIERRLPHEGGGDGAVEQAFDQKLVVVIGQPRPATLLRQRLQIQDDLVVHPNQYAR